MAQNRDWYPTGRQNQINFTKKWMSVFTELAEEGGTQKKWQAWGIPAETFAAFGTAYADALVALDRVIESGLREGPLHIAAQETFAALEAGARNLKRRYLFSPPLTAADMDTLGIKAPDTSRTPVPVPKHPVTIKGSNPDQHVIQLTMIPPETPGQDLSAFKYNIRVGILSRDGAAPARAETAPYYIPHAPAIPEDLPKQFNRSRRKELFPFTALDAGNTAYFSVCYQNAKGDNGPWSALISVIIT